MAALRPTPHIPNRLDKLMLLRAQVDEEIAAEERRLARISRLHGQVEARRVDAAMALPAAVVRAWARDNNVVIGDRGRVGLGIRLRCLDAREEAS